MGVVLGYYGITGLRDYGISGDQTGSFEGIKARKGTGTREERRGSAVQGNDRNDAWQPPIEGEGEAGEVMPTAHECDPGPHALDCVALVG